MLPGPIHVYSLVQVFLKVWAQGEAVQGSAVLVQEFC